MLLVFGKAGVAEGGAATVTGALEGRGLSRYGDTRAGAGPSTGVSALLSDFIIASPSVSDIKHFKVHSSTRRRTLSRCASSVAVAKPALSTAPK